MTAILVLFAFSCAKKKEIYYCPMHTSYTSDRPGTCPICNMDLVKKEDHSERSKDPSTLLRTEADGKMESKNGMESEIHHASPSNDRSSEFFLSSEKQQSIGIRTELVSRRSLVKKMSLYSSVAYDPELYSALLEYKQAIQSSGLLPESSSSLGIGNLQLRLRQLGLSTEQIRVWSSGQRDPSELIVGGKNGRAHIYSQVYESELSIAKPGLNIQFKTDVYPDKEFGGKIKSIDNIVDKNSRTLRLRSEVSDPGHLLKPQMFGETMIEISLPGLLTIPTSAILDTGVRKIVYVQTNPNSFRAVTVKIGKSVDTWSEVLSGLEEGQSVVSESTFLVDSEAKIRFGNNAHNH
ncbi:efflux RND transporter periplasmic adaptor subunit [Leptospira ilyithenensis]|nr:efflux RND transporter periplasmic adaptor subunit [Leptospira ilyithenensis]